MAKKPPAANEIKTSEHVFIAGMTGTGKSVLARNYLARFPAVAMLDSKGDSLYELENGRNPWPQVDPKKLTVITHLDRLPEVTTPYLIYAPDYSELDPIFYNEFFKWAYFRKDIVVWVDEAMEASGSSQTIPEFYKAILTRGRSRNTAVWSLTQRPMGLSPLILSQSTHMFAFDLQLIQDRERMAKVSGVPEFLDKPGDYNFWYFKQGMQHAEKATLKIPGLPREK